MKDIYKSFAEVERFQRFIPRAGKTVPIGKVVFKAAGQNVVKMLVTSPGVVAYNSMTGHGVYNSKFRVRQVKVLGVINSKGEYLSRATSDKNSGNHTTYTVDKIVNPDGFTDYMNDHCGQGIHCFATFQRAARLARWKI